jgi:hypothetical protein
LGGSFLGVSFGGCSFKGGLGSVSFGFETLSLGFIGSLFSHNLHFLLT